MSQDLLFSQRIWFQVYGTSEKKRYSLSQRIWFQVYGTSEKKRYSQKRILVYNFGRDTSINSS